MTESELEDHGVWDLEGYRVGHGDAPADDGGEEAGEDEAGVDAEGGDEEGEDEESEDGPFALPNECRRSSWCAMVGSMKGSSVLSNSSEKNVGLRSIDS